MPTSTSSSISAITSSTSPRSSGGCSAERDARRSARRGLFQFHLGRPVVVRPIEETVEPRQTDHRIVDIQKHFAAASRLEGCSPFAGLLFLEIQKMLFEAGTTNAKNGGEPVRPDQSPVGHARQLEPGSPVIVETIGIGL